MRWLVIILISGTGRSGKTTLTLHHLLNSDFGYVNFDDERLSEIKSNELNDLLSAFCEIYGEV